MVRERLAPSRESITVHFTVMDASGYLTVGLYPDGRPGEVFLYIAKVGSTLRGVLDSLARMMSHALQSGVSIDELVDSLIDTTYEPSGWTNDPDIPTASSLTDYIGRRLKLSFGTQPEESSP